MDSLTKEAAALAERHGIAGRLEFRAMYGGIVAALSHQGAHAIVALQGAQVLSYTTQDCGEVLWLSPQARLGTGKAVRGGIPVCWPWFGPHPQGGSRPAHGLVRARPWRVLANVEGRDGIGLMFCLTPQDLQCADWPHNAGVQVEVYLGDRLNVYLSTANFGGARLSLTQALHTYLRVGDIADVRIGGLERKPFIDQLDPGTLKSEVESINVTHEIDRIYQDTKGPVTLTDLSLGRRIVIAKKRSLSTVVWNPWVEKSARLGDMGEDGYRRMMCIETANAGADIFEVAPQKVRRLETTITVQPLAV